MIKTALRAINILRIFKKIFGRYFVYIKKPIWRIVFGFWKFIIKPLSLSFYKTYLLLKKFFTEIYNPGHSKILSSLNNRYVINAAIVIIAAFVIANNINAKETRDETFGEKSIIYFLASQIDLGKDSDEFSITEKINYGAYNPAETTNAPLSYLDSGLGVKGRVEPRETVLEEMINEGTEIPTAQGGSALLKPQIASTKLNQTERDRPLEYIVEEGDTVSTIAQKFNVSTNTILWENKLTAYSYIRPGDKLTILPVSGISHTVKSGDNVSKIAKNYKADENKIIAWNKLADASDLDVGQKIIVPDGVPPAVAVPRATTSRNVAIPPSQSASAGGKMLWPTSWRIITQYYSWRHTGLDIDGDYNSPIYASEGGTVIFAGGGWNGGYGIEVVIDHGNGVKTRYAHASKIFVKVGDEVGKGQTIAMVGTTGRSTGTHLHFEVMVNGRKMNPLSYIR